MIATSHAACRIRQRRIHGSVVDLLLEEGAPLPGNPDRLLLTREHARQLFQDGLVEPDLWARAEKDLPLVGVVRDGRIITVFRVTRRVKRTARGRGHSRFGRGRDANSRMEGRE